MIMFPVYVFLAFVGINVFERGLMDYHDRRIARERKEIGKRRKKQRRASHLGDGLDDSDFSNYESDFDYFTDDSCVKSGILHKRGQKRPSKRVHFSPHYESRTSLGKSAFPDRARGHEPACVRNSSKDHSWNGTHWDDFIEDWTEDEPMVNPWGTSRASGVQNSFSYGQAPYMQAAHAQKTKAR